MAAIIERVGPCKLSYREPVFETLVRSIVFQQLSGKAATTIFNRLVEAAGGKLTPEAILKLRTPTLRKVGLSKQKASYIRDLATRAQAKEIDFEALPALSDEEIITALTKVKGIGVWTAHMFLLFALRRENVLPTGDLGVRAAIRKLYKKRSMPSPGIYGEASSFSEHLLLVSGSQRTKFRNRKAFFRSPSAISEPGVIQVFGCLPALCG